ncbi:acid-sensing ion channel 1-like [Sitophilus oryzae]|uniref:Acid-sensing ion channel 1-like n=1 Tax=Sitophilus oryzae TaxID=7048 RepID=A0A6J2YFJ4_SITOR|nr:acid-sensing ion channel 1-like [Sitophilus oryzae]
MSKKASKLLWKRISTSYKYLKISWTVQVREFFEYSTLHGVKYIAEHGRPFLERFLWFVCVLIGAVATVVVIFSLWEKFQTNPTITGLDTDFHNWEVPFPAVILCPTDPAKQEQIRRLLDITENSTTQDLQKADFIYDLTKLDFDSIPIFTKKYTEADTYIDKNEDIRNYIYKFMDDCTDVFDNCSFKDTPFGCCSAPDKRFTPVFTETGFCHSFNSRHFRRSNNTASAEPEQFNMQYIKEADTKWSLQFALKTGEAVTSIYILNSDEMVSMNIQPQLEWDYQVYKMAFSMKQTYTTEDTRQLSIKQRKCVFGDEIPLHGFIPHYHQRDSAKAL